MSGKSTAWPKGHIDFSDRTQPPWNYYYEPDDVIRITTDDDTKRERGYWYFEHDQGTPNDPQLLEDAKERNQLSKVIEQCGTWAVTTYGMECLTWQYAIISGRLGKDEPHGGWCDHFRRKTQYNIVDFTNCYQRALKYHNEHTPWPRPTTSIPREQFNKLFQRKPKAKRERKVGALRLRFLILKRDNYRCRLCGRGAEDGVKLHVDHIIAKSKGGLYIESNLWTLCLECNLGKGTLEL